MSKETRNKLIMKTGEEIEYWVFSSYKNENDYENNQPFFEKEFTDFNKMKTFSANHSYKNRIKYSEYCSDYKKINSLNKQD